MIKKIIIFGAGGHANSIIDVIESTKRYKIMFLVDKFNGRLRNYRIYKENNDLSYYKKFTNNFAIGIGQIKDYKKREKIYKKIKLNKIKLPSIISPFAYVSKSVKFGEGTIVMHHAIVNANTIIRENCIINTKALIEHDNIINKNSHVSTAAVINGGCEIGENSFIGSNSTIIQGIKIGANSIIGAGKTIIKNLKKNSLVN